MHIFYIAKIAKIVVSNYAQPQYIVIGKKVEKFLKKIEKNA